MKLKRVLAMSLSLTMGMGLLGACGNQEGSANSAALDGQSAESEVIGQTVTEANGETPEKDSAYHVDWEDMAEINMLYMASGAVPNGLSEVEAAINEITETEINTHVNLEMIEVGNYIQQVSLKMSSGEPVDIILTFPGGSASFAGMVNQKQLMDITDLMSEYGQPVLDTVGDYIKATTVDGKIMGVPVYRNVVTNFYMVMRTDVLEDLGLLEQAMEMASLKDFEKILKAVKESDSWSYLSGLAPAGGNGGILISSGGFAGIDSFGDNTLFDPLGSANLVGVDLSEDNQTVQLVTEMDEYRETIELTHDWYEKGYVYKDSVTDKSMASELVKANKVFAYLSAGELGAESSAQQSCGMPMTCVKLLTLPITTSSCTKFTWAVPNSSEYPEAAVTFLSMMYTDSRINNLLAWGIEGRDYIVENGTAKYPDGVTEAPYHSADYITGNQFLTVPWEGTEDGIREKALEEMENAVISPYLGFTCNTDPITNEIAAITNVSAEYEPQVNSGIVEVNTLDEYIEKLKASNVDKVIAEYQAQLDEWYKNNK